MGNAYIYMYLYICILYIYYIISHIYIYYIIIECTKNDGAMVFPLKFIGGEWSGSLRFLGSFPRG
jgi:hypothetical protein